MSKKFWGPSAERIEIGLTAAYALNNAIKEYDAMDAAMTGVVRAQYYTTVRPRYIRNFAQALVPDLQYAEDEVVALDEVVNLCIGRAAVGNVRIPELTGRGLPPAQELRAA
ncbi:hypothetical protein A3F65_01135 [Candidatus Saccharibacteria bacterium RIFCSPHIGHO2_12_FULL_47_16b]|nr:MAG: hypothetical protein A3F65_01135 [Candidatus Saccharibacteria bacterium RIFCSPHIGHO2_12_FULL_47_16b]